MKRRVQGQKRKKKVIADLPSGIGVTETVNGNGDKWWRVRIGKRFTGGEVKRKDFKTVGEARDWINGEIQQDAKTGTETHTDLSAAQLAEAKNAFARLKSTPLSLTAAVTYALKHAAPPKGILGWTEAVSQWLSAPRKRPLAEVTANAYRVSVRLLENESGKKKPHEITVTDIVDFLTDDDWEPSTQAHHLRNLRVFFGWLTKFGHSGGNPTIDIPEPAFDGEVSILTPVEAASLLLACPDDMVSSVALGLFGGLRTSEIRRLVWEEIGETEIEIKAAKTKTRRRRMVPITPTLKAWLGFYKGPRSGLIAPSDWREKFEEVARLAGWRDDKKKSTWPRNAMRHSFGTYRYADTKNETQTAAEMGNSPDMIHNHYRRVVSSKDTASYWSLVPAVAKNILKFKAA